MNNMGSYKPLLPTYTRFGCLKKISYVDCIKGEQCVIVLDEIAAIQLTAHFF